MPKRNTEGAQYGEGKVFVSVRDSDKPAVTEICKKLNELGFTERLNHYLAQPQPKKAFALAVGKKKVKPTHLLLGDPVEADGKGLPKDIPLALHFLELLARTGGLPASPGATKVLNRLLKDCDDQGVWNPKGLRSLPKTLNRMSYHTFPLDAESKAPEFRQVDVTFRLALIAKVLGWSLEYV